MKAQETGESVSPFVLLLTWLAYAPNFSTLFLTDIFIIISHIFSFSFSGVYSMHYKINIWDQIEKTLESTVQLVIYWKDSFSLQV